MGIDTTKLLTLGVFDYNSIATTVNFVDSRTLDSGNVDGVLNLLGFFPCGSPNGTYNQSALNCCLNLNQDWFDKKWGGEFSTGDVNYGGVLEECDLLEKTLKECKESCLNEPPPETTEGQGCLNDCQNNRDNQTPSTSTCASKQKEKELDQQKLKALNANCEYLYGKQNRYDDPFGNPIGRTTNPYYKFRRIYGEDGQYRLREAPRWKSPSEAQ